MNIYKDLLFMHGFVLDPKLVADPEDRRGESHGNRVARRRGRPPVDPVRRQARNPEVVAGGRTCTAGGCG